MIKLNPEYNTGSPAQPSDSILQPCPERLPCGLCRLTRELCRMLVTVHVPDNNIASEQEVLPI